MLVPRALGYLAASRYGLAEDELIDLLSRDLQVYEWFFKKSYHLPADLVHCAIQYRRDHRLTPGAAGQPHTAKRKSRPGVAQGDPQPPGSSGGFPEGSASQAGWAAPPVVLWSRLSFDLAPYLTERMVDGSPSWASITASWGMWRPKSFFPMARINAYHERLADYFRFKADPSGGRGWTGNDPHGLSDLPYHLLRSGKEAEGELTELLEDVLYLNARTSVDDVWQLLDDYSGADGKGDTGQYRAFVAKHAQTLFRHDGQLAALLSHEGFPRAKAQVELAQGRGLYTQAWLRTERQAEQPRAGTDAGMTTLGLVSSWEFQPSRAVCLAAKAKLAFHVIRLGAIGIVDIERACSFDQTIAVRRMRPLALFASQDGRLLVLAYENGEADVLELDWSSQGLARQRVAAAFRYLLPELDAPAMHWDGHRLVYQGDDGGIVGLEPTTGEQVCLVDPGGTDGPGELRSVAALDGSLVLAVSSGVDTQLLLQGNGTYRQLCRIENAEVVALCACGTSRVAAAFSNRDIRVLRVEGAADEIARVTAKDLPTCMAYRSGSLVFATDWEEMYGWRLEETGGPMLLQSSQTKAVSRCARQLAFSEQGTLLAVSQSTAALLAAVLGNEPRPRTVLSLFRTAGHSCAVVKREKSVLLVDTASGSETGLAVDPSRIMRFSMDGRGNLLCASSDGTGFVLDGISESRRPVRAIPTSIAAVAGDPGGGFWMADRLGELHRVETDGSVRPAWSPESTIARVQELLCAGRTLVWRGWCSDRTESGEERPDTLLFFEAGPDRRLHQVGRRLFGKSEGFVETMAHDASRNSLIVILGNSANAARGIREGSVEQFIARRESHRAIDWLRSYVRAADCRTGSNLYLLSEDGSISCLDSRTSERKAVLSPSVPLQVMSAGGGEGAAILLADAQSHIFLCRMENG